MPRSGPRSPRARNEETTSDAGVYDACSGRSLFMTWFPLILSVAPAGIGTRGRAKMSLRRHRRPPISILPNDVSISVMCCGLGVTCSPARPLDLVAPRRLPRSLSPQCPSGAAFKSVGCIRKMVIHTSGGAGLVARKFNLYSNDPLYHAASAKPERRAEIKWTISVISFPPRRRLSTGWPFLLAIVASSMSYAKASWWRTISTTSWKKSRRC
jgi:hypothetical protein